MLTDSSRHRHVHHPDQLGRLSGARRSGDRWGGSGSVLLRRAGPVQPAGIPVLERRQALWSQVAKLQNGLRRATPILRPGTTSRQPRIINLLTDPKELEPVDSPHLHTWVVAHFTRLIAEFQAPEARATHPVRCAAQLHPG